MDRELRERLASRSQLFFSILDLLWDKHQLLFSLVFSLARKIKGSVEVLSSICSKKRADFLTYLPLTDWVAWQALPTGLRTGKVDPTDRSLMDKAQGAPGIELAFSFTRLVKPGVISLSRLSRGLSLKPARILRLNNGLVRKGLDGDPGLIEDEPFTAGEDFFFSKSSNTPLLGADLQGRVWATVHKGEVIYIDGKAKGRDFHDHRQVV